MDSKVLVAYGSKYGATAEIAEKIGEGLRQAGTQGDVLPVKEVKDVTPYHGIVLGSAVYIGQWRKEAVKFCNKNEKQLVGKPVWLFSSGPAGKGDPVELLNGWRYPKKIQTFIDIIKPVDIAVFHGVVNVDKMNALERQMIKMVKSGVGDYRDWDAITAWAKGIADEVEKMAGESL